MPTIGIKKVRSVWRAKIKHQLGLRPAGCRVAAAASSLAFVSRAALGERIGAHYGLARQLVAVQGCRGLGKRDMKLNDALPRIEVDPESYEVRADGVLLTCEPARTLPLAQRYFLF